MQQQAHQRAPTRGRSATYRVEFLVTRGLLIDGHRNAEGCKRILRRFAFQSEEPLVVEMRGGVYPFVGKRQHGEELQPFGIFVRYTFNLFGIQRQVAQRFVNIR